MIGVEENGVANPSISCMFAWNIRSFFCIYTFAFDGEKTLFSAMVCFLDHIFSKVSVNAGGYIAWWDFAFFDSVS